MTLEDLWLDHIGGGTFPREFGNPVRTKACRARWDYLDAIKGNRARDCYITVYQFNGSFIKEYPKKKLYDTARINCLYFDFDVGSELNLMLALADVRKLRERAPADLRIYFSGNKGFNAYLDFPEVKLKHPKETLQEFCERYVGNLKTADRRPFGDIARISRIPGTINTGSKKRWGQELYCTPITAEELDATKNELDIVKLARGAPDGREIKIQPCDEIAEVLERVDVEIEEKVKTATLIREVMDIKGVKPKPDDIAEKLIANASAFRDGRKRILAYLIIPRLKHLGEGEIEERCRQFVEGSGESWRNYRGYAKANIRRTLKMDWAPWRVGTFLSGNPDLRSYFGKVEGGKL